MTEPDLELLRRYARENSQDAFAELVRRHLDLVHSAALRQIRSPQLAEEVAQSVFTDLARNAAKLSSGTGVTPVLTAWLYQVTRRTAIDVVRREARRQLREQIATEMNTMNATANDWTHIEPLLDEAMHALDDTDRAAVLLRYFENKSLREVGATLGTSDDAAQKRVSRAVERLREFFAKRGVTIGASGLVVVISTNAVQAAPVGLAVTISATAALAGTAIATTTTTAAFKTIAMTTLQKTLITSTTIAVGVATTLVIQHQSHVKLREQNESLQQRVEQLTEQIAANERFSAKRTLKPHLPAPPMVVTPEPAEPSANDSPFTNAFTRSIKGALPQVSSEQLAHFVEQSRRSAASLLAAFHISGDKAFLQEALEKYPSDPQVNLAALATSGSSPEQRRQWLETFKQSAPDNMLANYLAASEYFKSGQTEEALRELLAASGKSNFQDYWLDRTMSAEEAYLAAGLSKAEATAAGISMRVPEFRELRQLTHSLTDLVGSYRQAGDETSVQAVVQMGLHLGQSLDLLTSQYSLAEYAMGMEIENQFLGMMNPNSAFGSSGQIVRNQLDELDQRRAALKTLVQQANGILAAISDQDLINYTDRMRVFGGIQAMQWLVDKNGQK